MRRALVVMLTMLLSGVTASTADMELQFRQRPAQAAPETGQPAPPAAGTPARIVPPGKEQPAAADDKLDLTPPPDKSASPADVSSWQNVVRSAPGCLVFVDGCRTCTKNDSGFACSNLPIACQPKEWTCSKQKP